MQTTDFYSFVVVNHMLHSAARRPKGLGWRYEAHLRGLELCNINLTTTDFYSFVGCFLPCRAKTTYKRKCYHTGLVP
jgi:hypothetical protein